MGYFSIWQKLEPILAKNVNWVNFHCRKWPNVEQIILSSGHTDSDPL